jgi:hypothetical protein
MTMAEDTRNPTFSARDVFHPASPYSRMRLCYDPELKMRGLFYELEARRRATLAPPDILRFEPPELARAAPLPDVLAARTGTLPRPPGLAFGGEPPHRVASERPSVVFEPSPYDPAATTLKVRLTIKSEAGQPPRETPCRVFILTPGILKRLCGPQERGSDQENLDALTHLFQGNSTADRREISAILAATAEMTQGFAPEGVCDFEFPLPKQTARIDGFPAGTVLLFVIQGEPKEGSDV